MSVYFCSDLHIGHKSILEFSPGRPGDTVTEHDEIIWSELENLSKRDVTFFMGDVCFDLEQMPRLENVPGRKFLVRGNHDKFDFGVYAKYFDDIFGLRTYKGYWLSHAPVHPNELRGRVNLHGHVHHNTINDSRYFNLCPENIGKYLISLEEVRRRIDEG